MRKKARNDFTNPDIIKKIEEIEQSPKTQARLNAVKNEMKNTVINPLYIGCLGFIILLFILVHFKSYSIFFICIVWFFGYKFYKKNQATIANSYIQNFLLPVLKEILPDTKVNYFEGISADIASHLFYHSEAYSANCHILFGDESETEFCNLKSCHYSTDRDGNKQEVTDFIGQVLTAHFDTNIKGHIRIVPVEKRKFLGFRDHSFYGGKRKGEEKIQTESIQFNGFYSIFSTDAFYTRLILDPNIIEILTAWKDKMKVSLYINAHYLAASFESQYFLFPIPKSKEEIEHLSLVREYEKIIDKLSDFYALLDCISEKL